LIESVPRDERLVEGVTDSDQLLARLIAEGGAKSREELGDEAAQQAFDLLLRMAVEIIAEQASKSDRFKYASQVRLLKDLDRIHQIQADQGDQIHRIADAIQEVHGHLDPSLDLTIRGYLQQVSALVPTDLKDRAIELEEIQEFVQGADPVWWWLGGPWSGKTALMATIATRTLKGAYVVPYFVLGREVSANHRGAFLARLIPHLAAITGGPQVLPSQTVQLADLFRGLLATAAARCRSSGERLLLLIDGLDEDMGTYQGLGSIAATIPSPPPEGLQILVASRPSPELPPDVPDDHVLRDFHYWHKLTPSRAADVARIKAEFDLTELVDDELGESVAALITAAGAPLSVAELTELVKHAGSRTVSHRQIDRLLRRRPEARSFLPVTISDDPDEPNGSATIRYRLGHETLDDLLLRLLDPSISALSLSRDSSPSSAHNLSQIRKVALYPWRRHIHAWAAHYKKLGWPLETPPYLLGDYFVMLLEAHDEAELISVATDAVRHDRMLARSGGDAPAVHEVNRAIDLLMTSRTPDLASIARLAEHRSFLDRSHRIDWRLPALWASLGRPHRAHNLAESLPDDFPKVSAYSALARAHADKGDLARAQAAAERAEAVSRMLPERASIQMTQIDVADAWRAAGFRNRERLMVEEGEVVARTFVGMERVANLIKVAGAWWRLGETEAARAGMHDAELTAQKIDEDWVRAAALVDCADAWLAIGDLERARAAAARAMRDAEGSPHGLWTMIQVVGTWAAAGDSEKARASAENAETLAWGMVSIQGAAEVALWAAEAWTAAGDNERARTLIERAEASLETLPDDYLRIQAIYGTAQAWIRAGDHERADAIAKRLRTSHWWPSILFAQATSRAAANETALATDLADQVEIASRQIDPVQRIRAMATMASACAAIGDKRRALISAERAAMVAEPLVVKQPHILAEVAFVWSAAGAAEQAGAIVQGGMETMDKVRVLGKIAPAWRDSQPTAARAAIEMVAVEAAGLLPELRRGFALVDIARAYLALGDDETAEALLVKAEAIGWNLVDEQPGPLFNAAKVHVLLDQLELATQMARRLPYPQDRAEILAAVAKRLAAQDQPRSALRVSEDIEELARSVSYPAYKGLIMVEAAEAFHAVNEEERAFALLREAEAVAPHARYVPERSRILVKAADVYLIANRLDRAEAIAWNNPDPDGKAKTLADLATRLPARADTLIAAAFRFGSWTTPLDALAETRPEAFRDFADQFLELGTEH
jgi:tetratricopeptide (TPR) repeat protein